MRLVAALLTFACLSACNTVPTGSQQALVRDRDWRQQQAARDAQAILQGMAQARQQAEEMARTAP